MLVSTSYTLRDGKITSSISIPTPTVKNLTEVLRHVAWVSRQQDAVIRVE